VAQCPYEGEPLFLYSKLTGIGASRGVRRGGKRTRERPYVDKPDRMEGGLLRWELFVRFSSVALGPNLSRSCPAIVPQFFTTWALQAQYATYAHAFLLSFFVIVENKRLVNPTPKRKVAGNRAGNHV
jgi:hypothetical protein